MSVSQFLGKMFTPLASVQVPSQNNIFYSLFMFTLVLERNSSLIIISQVYVCLYALVYVCVCVCGDFWYFCSHPLDLLLSISKG